MNKSFIENKYDCTQINRCSPPSLCLILAVILLFTNDSSAQSSNHKYYDINKVYSNEVIKGISKDESGLIWLATDQGVISFDGQETELYHGLSEIYTKKFLKRRNGDFLILTDYGIRKIIKSEDSTYFEPFFINDSIADNQIYYAKSLFEDQDGNIWVGETNAVVKITDTGFQRYFLGIDYQSINYHRSFTFAEDAFGNIWVAPYNGRLLSYNKATDTLEDVQIPYPLTDVTCIFILQGDYVYIGGKEGLLKLKIDSNRDILEKTFVEGPEDISSAIAIGNAIYVGTWENGLYYAHKDDLEFSAVAALPFNDIVDMHYDANQQEVWIAGSENIGFLKPAQVKPIGKAGRYRVESLTLKDKNTLYYSTGPQVFEHSLSFPETINEIYTSQTTYFDQIVADSNKIWIGDAFGGIYYFDLLEKELQQIRDTTNAAITHVLKDKEQRIWFAGGKGLTMINQDMQLKTYNDVPNSRVLRASNDGRIYCGGVGDTSILYAYNTSNNNFSRGNLKYDFDVKPSIFMYDMAFDSVGNPWLATSDGLLLLEKENEQFKASRIMVEGNADDEAYKAIAIHGNQVWLASTQALLLLKDGEVVTYNQENGLPSGVIKERSFVIENDILYLATAKGPARINLREHRVEATSKPVIKSINVNGRKMMNASTEPVEFPYDARMQVDFISLAYPGHNLNYQTRIKGLDEGWSEASTNNSLSVLSFAEGNYTLQVRARDIGYLWSEPSEFSFTIAAPWFKSIWALILLPLLALAIIVFVVRVYHLHLIRQKQRLKAIIENRTEEINQQKNEIIEQKNKLIAQKEELIVKNNAVYQSQQALSEADLNYLQLKEKQLEDQIEHRNKQITTHTLNIIQKNEMLKDLRDQLEGVIKSEGTSSPQLRKLLKLIDESFRLDKDWNDFKLYFEQIYTGFYTKLKMNYPNLTNQELRHCALIRLNLSNQECATILGISPNSIKVTRTRLRKKLKLENNQSLSDLIMGI